MGSILGGGGARVTERQLKKPETWVWCQRQALQSLYDLTVFHPQDSACSPRGFTTLRRFA
jgi:hypothetical protein